jgi:DNA-binding CsgD family transcriptional regulator
MSLSESAPFGDAPVAPRSPSARGLPIPTPRRSVENWRAAPHLNERDLELLRHLSDGLSTERIAAAMAVTSNTTRTRIRRVQRKLVVSRREQLVVAARRLGVV